MNEPVHATFSSSGNRIQYAFVADTASRKLAILTSGQTGAVR